MLVFTEVVAAGGITAAAARLGLRKSTVSRRLAALEERLGTRLLERNTRRLRLTESGREYHAHCARLVAEAREVNRAVSESRGTPRGTLRLATSSLLGELLTPVLAEFLLRHPAVRVEVSLAQAHVDLVVGQRGLQGRVKVTKLNVDDNQATAGQYGVRAMPTLLFFKQGKVVGQIVGAVPRARLESAFQQVL
jgi:DNA-binding transcriptional LysR family regulator